MFVNAACNACFHSNLNTVNCILHTVSLKLTIYCKYLDLIVKKHTSGENISKGVHDNPADKEAIWTERQLTHNPHGLLKINLDSESLLTGLSSNKCARTPLSW